MVVPRALPQWRRCFVAAAVSACANQTVARTANSREAHSARVDVDPDPDAVSSQNVPDYNNLGPYGGQKPLDTKLLLSSAFGVDLLVRL